MKNIRSHKSDSSPEYGVSGDDGRTDVKIDDNQTDNANRKPVTDQQDTIQELRTSLADLTSEVQETHQVQLALDRVTEESEKQRRLYDTILSCTPDLVYVFDLNHRFSYANKALLELWGRTWDDAIGKTCLELGYPEWHAAMHDREIEQVISTRGPIRGDVPFSGASGHRIYDYIFVPVIGENGDVEAIAGTTRDVTERRQTEEALEYRTEQFKTLLSRSPLGIIVVDSQLLIREANQTAATELAGDSALTGRPLREVLDQLWHEGIADELEAKFLHTLRSGESSCNPEWIEKRRGRDVSGKYDWQVHRTTLPDGEHGVVCYFRDISAEIEAREKAVAASAAKSRFLASMSHELRTPLNAIIGYGEMLREELSEMKQEQMVGDMEKILLSGNHLLAVISDILDLSKIEAGKIELEMKRFNAREALNEAIDMVMPLIERNLNVIKSEGCAADPIMIWSDPTRFRQIVFNLLSNAGKFTEKGVIRIDCRQVSAAGNSDWLELVISDTGIGISPDKINSLFTEFAQFDSAAPGVEGTGLGLSINKRLCELLGGDIGVTSEPGKGSVFTVRLPVDKRAGS